jgi:hypothetical protein
MKIFVGYGFNERDKWIEEMVFPIIGAFGDQAITGKNLQGEQITDVIRKEIAQSDALIGFTTRRGEPYGDNNWRTHRWVTDEMTVALSNQIPLLEVREEGVDDQGGILGDRQRITYKEKERDRCLVELVGTIGRWHREAKIKLKLLPEACVQELFPLLRKADLKCTYKLLIAGEEGIEIPTRILPITGGLFIITRNVPREALIQIHIEYQGKHWTSNFECVDDCAAYLRKEE